MNTALPGRRYALRIELFTGYTSSVYTDIIKSNGLLLFIHNSSYLPIFGTEGTSLSVGYDYDVVLSQILINKQPSPYSNCIPTDVMFDSELYKATVKQVGNYNQKYCLQLCSQEFLIGDNQKL